LSAHIEDMMTLRGFVATNWMTVIDMLDYFERVEWNGKRVRYARVIVDNNGGEPFETYLSLAADSRIRGDWTALVAQ
jgi:hypothetical protein